MQLGTVLARHARYWPDRNAVIHEDMVWTYRVFNTRVNRLSNALLRAGIRRGDKIACVLPNCLEILDLYWATAKIGAVVVPLSPLLTGRGLISLIRHADAAMVLVGSDHAASLAESKGEFSNPSSRLVIVGGVAKGCITYEDLIHGAADFEPSVANGHERDPLMIVYSSGTTGEPKGIVLSHYARAMYCILYASAWRMSPESISLHAGSLVFNGAFMTLLPSFFLGGTYILHRQFDPAAVLRDVEARRVTHMVMVPSQIIALLNCPQFVPERLASLEALVSLGAPLHLAHKQRLLRLFPGRFYELYGLAEGFMTILDRTDAEAKLGSVGTPPPFFEMRIVDGDGQEVPPGTVGEIVGRGPIMMEGYHRRPDLTATVLDKQGWLRSGDLGYVDEDGYLFLVDRQKDMIKSGGISVYPRDIEDVIVQHAAVREAAVFGVPDEKWGETPVGAVLLEPSARISADELKSWVNSNVNAKFQRLSNLVVLVDFPRNAAGKILKRALQESYLADCRPITSVTC